MAGADPTGAFDADEFRSAIQLAMQMGASNNTNEQVTFIWKEEDTYTPAGPDGASYNWGDTPTSVTQEAKQTVVLNCAVEYAAGADTTDAMGTFDASHAVLTLLDEDYQQTINASQVKIGGYTFVIDAPGAIPFGLFNVNVYQYRVSALS